MIHILLHFLVPALLARLAKEGQRVKTWLILSAGILIDVDHLLADPIYDPNRCSIGFHPLHTVPAILIYLGLCFFPKTRLAGIGLMLHIVLDYIDCLFMQP